ncbi:GntR family transcriptional regulator [Profundibacter sp.]|uniref:GntR family transcriptional regulator n=1 Tax=Profundibacter sp. TaxID=3101071 RepID=UPI003D0EB601
MEKDKVQKSRSISKHIEETLRADIASGQIDAGARLDETKLAERFSVSRTPVREALNRLVAQGILVSNGRRGVRVTEYSREELAHMFEAMHEIEALCAGMAAKRLTLLARSSIEAAQAECIKAAKANDLPGFLRANETFHLAIYRATENPFIFDLASGFRQRTGPFRAKKFSTAEDLLISARSHEDIIKHLFSTDSAAAASEMGQHMKDTFMSILAKM